MTTAKVTDRAVETVRHDDILEIRIDHPPVNALGRSVRSGLLDAIDAFEVDENLAAAVITARGRLFSAGADIREFDHEPQPPHLPDLIDRVEQCRRPVVAALHGTAMGGALELAMGCHYRVAAKGVRMGLPEVRIGIIPGAGGTQRMPRLVGVKRALELIVSGSTIEAENADEAGLIDALLPPEQFHDQVLEYVRRLVADDAPARRTCDLRAEPASESVEKYRRRLDGRSGSRAALACIEAVEASASSLFSEGIARERNLFADCVLSPEAAALRHVFFAERRISDLPDVAEGVKPREIAQVCVIGAGTMGTGIAMAFADAGLDVTLVDQSKEAADKGLERIAEQYLNAADRGRISGSESRERIRRIRVAERAAMAESDLVIEAVFEDLTLKKRIFAEMDRVCRPGAILATNTSTLDVDEIAAATARPGDVLGLHFFSPANIMRLLEIVRADRTADDVLVTATGLARQLGKVGIVAGVCDGFIGNRMLEGYLREAGHLLIEGATPGQIDRALTDWGWAMGPFAVSDLAGIDIGHHVRRQRGIDGAEHACYAVGEALFQQGRLGQKSGAGFYRYESGERRGQPDPEVAAIARQEAERFGIEQRKIGDEEIVERCLLPLINEGARVLEEGIALRAGDIDLVWIYGYGFPAFRGGPMHHAAVMGADRVLEGLARFGREDDACWQPAEGLEQFLRQQGTA